MKPNILMIVVDQLTSFVLRSYGGGVCKTPHLDKLAEQGVVFENMYCNYPLCSPSRAALMTGRLPSRIGAYDNGAELPASMPTFAHYLRSQGYYTAISGKMHFIGPDQFHGYEERLTTEIYPADFGWTPVTSYSEADVDDERRYAAGTSTTETVRDSGPAARTMQIDYDEEVCHRAVQEIFMQARHGDGRPFALTVSFTHPHDPYVTTREYWNRYTEDEIDRPRVPFVGPSERDPHSEALFYHYGQDKAPIDDETYKRARRGYYGMISYCDDLVGRLISALADAGVDKNTVVIFTSDHGDMIGERGMWFKKTLFEPAVAVPLLIWAPQMFEPGRVASPVSLIDILPTLNELAGGSAADLVTEIDGRSLLPALLKRPFENRPVFSEHIDGGTKAPRLMVREGGWKLVHSRSYPTQLYNLADDPLELKDLSDDPSGADALARLTKLINDNYDLERLEEEVESDQRVRRFLDEALSKGKVRAWDHLSQAQIDPWFVRKGDAFPHVERRGYLRYSDE
ncbi:choline-sulfatase [Pararhizobium sp. YC-54]|uniref:choline-sulfatase n=1 Tax=Pararhizobium sp. YC-54 TaxID=2986920 RepID=UPI0021F7BD33|nr:choline-sulfatase [Pararhizobium sp. YC-54]MCW0001490.1 choline-sulfatase [Pararhizobium sp. YC-54]